jgi:hypothetical protein
MDWLNFHHLGGISAEVDGRRVLAGKAPFLKAQAVSDLGRSGNRRSMSRSSAFSSTLPATRFRLAAPVTSLIR